MPNKPIKNKMACGKLGLILTKCIKKYLKSPNPRPPKN
jgi:hypothetical protein